MMVGLYACCAYLFKYHFAQLFQFIPCNFAYLFALPADVLHILRNIQKICVFQRASAPRAPPGQRMACGGSPRRADPRVPDRTDGPTRRGSRGLLVPGRGSGAGRTDVRPAPAPPPTAAPVPFFVFAATAAAVPGGLLAGKSRRAVHAGTLLPCSFLFRPSLLPRASGDPDRGGLVHRAVEPELTPVLGLRFSVWALSPYPANVPGTRRIPLERKASVPVEYGLTPSSPAAPYRRTPAPSDTPGPAPLPARWCRREGPFSRMMPPPRSRSSASDR